MEKSKDELSDAIVSLAELHWRKNKNPLLLSQLGPMLIDEEYDFKKIIQPLGLRAFIEFSLSHKVSVVAHPTQKMKIGVVPNGIEQRDAAILFENKERVDSVGPILRSTRTNYKIKQTIWYAFIKPLDSGRQRYVDMKDEYYHFEDKKGINSLDSSRFVEIPRDLIIENFENTDQSAIQIYRNFEVWVNQNNLNSEWFIIRDKIPTEHQGGCSDFLQFFEGLSSEELSKIHIPFETLFKILKK